MPTPRRAAVALLVLARCALPLLVSVEAPLSAHRAVSFAVDAAASTEDVLAALARLQQLGVARWTVNETVVLRSRAREIAMVAAARLRQARAEPDENDVRVRFQIDAQQYEIILGAWHDTAMVAAQICAGFGMDWQACSPLNDHFAAATAPRRDGLVLAAPEPTRPRTDLGWQDLEMRVDGVGFIFKYHWSDVGRNTTKVAEEIVAHFDGLEVRERSLPPQNVPSLTTRTSTGSTSASARRAAARASRASSSSSTRRSRAASTTG